MIGTLLNVGGIMVGGLVGLIRRKPLSAANENWLKVTLSAFTVFYGLRLTWLSMNGPFLTFLKQLVIVLLALTLGRVTGRLLRLQHFSNYLGRQARERLAAVRPGSVGNPGEGFKTCAALFCAAPLAWLGAVQDGLFHYPYPLAIKAVVDGLAAMGFGLLFGWAVLLAVVPVLAVQGTISLLCAYAEPFLAAHGLVNSIGATGGLLIFCVALLMLGLKRVELADYLPSLFFAPLITWVWK